MGAAGAGKDTVGGYLKSQYGYETVSFADGIKDCLSAIFGWDRAMLEGGTPKSRAWREQVDEWWAERLGIPKFTPRLAMTMFGSDVMRKWFNDRIWLLNTERKIASAFGPVVICDLRFKIEIDMVRNLGGKIYRIERGDKPIWEDVAVAAAKGDHSSIACMKDHYGIHEAEWEWRATVPDATLFNLGDMPSLYRQVDELTGRVPA